MNYKDIIQELGEYRVKVNEPMAEHTTFKIGGPADLYYEAETEAELVRVLGVVRDLGIPYFILGAGSNLLISDEGFRGIIIKNTLFGCEVKNENLLAKSGTPISLVLKTSLEQNLTGLEFWAGIPGTVGGAVRGNAGAWQEQTGDKVTRVKILTKNGESLWLNRDECNFNYRDSRFKQSGEFILEAEFALTKGFLAEIEKKIAENVEKRSTQPKEPSAGCIFVNPKPESAGNLIDRLDLKGQKVGGAMISEKHANFIVNTGGATATEVVALIDLVKKQVKENYGIDLAEEVVRIGEF